MADLDIDTALEWRGRTVVDRRGEKIGTLREIYLDEDERPHWGAVHTALFGLRQTLVPLDRAAVDDDRLQLPFDADHVKDGPNVDPEVQLIEDEEDSLYRHYGLAGAETSVGGDDRGSEPATPREGDNAMTRSEEEVEIGTRVRPRERVRIKKYVVTDHVEKTVPVKREEVRLEREDASPDD